MVNKHLPYNRDILRKQGYQYCIKRVNELEGLDIKGYVPEVQLFLHTNWRMNNELSQKDINQILLTYRDDPTRAETADLGVPCVIEGSVYAMFMDRVGIPVWEQDDYVIGGGDYGSGTSEKAGRTAFCFVGVNLRGDIKVYDEYTWDNNKHIPKSDIEVAEEVLDFYINNMNIYFDRTGIKIEKLQVRIDNSNRTFQQVLEQLAINRGIGSMFEFVLCAKLKIIDRIRSTLCIMGGRRLKISENCVDLIDELNLIKWKPGSNAHDPKRENDKDHSINAFEYAMEPFMYEIIPNEQKQFYYDTFSTKTKNFYTRTH